MERTREFWKEVSILMDELQDTECSTEELWHELGEAVNEGSSEWYAVYCRWEMSGIKYVKARDKAHARHLAIRGKIPEYPQYLPENAEYVKGSLKITDIEKEILYGTCEMRDINFR